MESRTLAKPVKVSPLIKLTRWTLLIFGAWYGRRKWHYYHHIQERRRMEYDRLKPALIAQRQKEILERATAEYKDIAQQMGVELPPDWTAKGL